MGDAKEKNGKGKGKNDYNYWSVVESDLLLKLLVDCASRGWRDHNGTLSKATVETKVLPKLNEQLQCEKTYQQYLSRLKYYKREYTKYSELMRHSSGFGWDPTTKKFTAPDEVWEDYFKSHPEHKIMRTKTCEDYEDLKIVVGNSTATGRHSLGLGDDTDATTYEAEDAQFDLNAYVFNPATQEFVLDLDKSVGQDAPVPSQAGGSEIPSQSSNQRKQTRIESERNTSLSEPTGLEQVVSSLTSSFERVENLLRKRERERETESLLWHAIKEIPNLTDPERYKVLDLLNSKTRKDAFLLMSLEERSNWVAYKLA